MKQIKKKWLSLMMCVVVLLTTLAPVWADESPQMDISTWAISQLNEGEKYGIFSIEWYYDQFKSEISEERLNSLLEGVDAKLSEIKDKVAFEPIETKQNYTREDVALRLYNVLASYGLTDDQTPIAFMQSWGILNGGSNGLMLDSSCNTEQAVLMGINTVLQSYRKLEEGSKGVFWKVENKGNTVYLLGSIHLGTTDIYPLNETLVNAYNASDVLLVEANLLNQTEGIEYFMSKAAFSDGTTLDKVISPELYEKTSKALELFGIDIALYNGLKPWSVANDLNAYSMMFDQSTNAVSEKSAAGIDMYFILNAFLEQKPIYELEGVAYQADLFDGLTPAFQATYLESIVDGILTPSEDPDDSSAALLNSWFEYWEAGDLESFKASFTAANSASGESELTTMLFGKRDVDMADKITTLLEGTTPTTYFVVVGAGHLIVDGNIVELLTEKGYKVVWMY